MKNDVWLLLLDNQISVVDLSLGMPAHNKHETEQLMERRANLVQLRNAIDDMPRIMGALSWLVHLNRGIGKNGCAPESSEWDAAWMEAEGLLFDPDVLVPVRASELSYPGRPAHVELPPIQHAETCAAHPRWCAGPCNCKGEKGGPA